MIANIQPQGNHVFATITGKEAKPAAKFGVRISKSLYWFTVDNWSAFKLVVGFQETNNKPG